MTADETSGSNMTEPPSSPAAEPETPASDADVSAEPEEDKLTVTSRVEDLGPCKKRLHVEVDRKHVDEKLDTTLNDLVETAMVPGFRPGHAPRALVAKRFRREMANQVKGELVAAAFEQALEEQDLALLSQPNLKLEDIHLPDDGPLTFDADVEVRPQFDVPGYKDIAVQRPSIDVTDQQVDEAVESLRDRGARLVPKDDEPAEAGDVIVADLTLTLADRTIREDTDINLRVEPTVNLHHVTIEGFQDALTGARAGEQRVCEARMSDQYEEDDLQGKPVQCAVTIKDVKRVERPELDQQAIEEMGLKSLEELREHLRRSLETRHRRESLNACRQQVYDHLLEQADWDLPEDMVAKEAERLAARYRLDMMMQGVAESQLDAHMDVVRASSQERAVSQLKSYFILDKIAQQEDVTVEPSDVDRQIHSLASRSNESPRRIRARLEKQDRMGLLEIQVLEQKTVDRILESARFEDVSFEEYNRRRQETRSDGDASVENEATSDGTGPDTES